MTAPDAGRIVFQGRALAGHSPREAIAAGIGMIHQHFTLVEAMTVAENVMLGWSQAGTILKPAEVIAKDRIRQPHLWACRRPQGGGGHAALRASPARRNRQGDLARCQTADPRRANVESRPLEVRACLSVIRRLKQQGHSVVFHLA